MLNNTESKDSLVKELKSILRECGLQAEALDIRQLKSSQKLIAAIQECIREMNEHRAAIDSIKFTKTYLAEKAGLDRATLGRTEYLDKILKTLTPAELVDERDLRLRQQEEIITELKRREAYTLDQDMTCADLQHRIGVLENEVDRKDLLIVEKDKQINEMAAQLQELRQSQLLTTPATNVSQRAS